MPKSAAQFIYTAVIGKHGWVGRVLGRNRKHLSYIGCGFETYNEAMQEACAQAYFLSEAAGNPSQADFHLTSPHSAPLTGCALPDCRELLEEI